MSLPTRRPQQIRPLPTTYDPFLLNAWEEAIAAGLREPLGKRTLEAWLEADLLPSPFRVRFQRPFAHLEARLGPTQAADRVRQLIRHELEHRATDPDDAAALAACRAARASEESGEVLP